MIVWMTAVELLATFIEQIIFFRITALVFQKKYIWKTAILAAVGAAVVVVCNQQSMFSWLTMMITVAYDCIAGFALFRQKWLSIFSISCLYLLCLGCLDFLVASLLAFTQGGTDFFATVAATGNAASFVYCSDQGGMDCPVLGGQIFHSPYVAPYGQTG